jgi:hypothetical protein
MPSGGLVANHNQNQCITITLGWRKFTVNNGKVTEVGSSIREVFIVMKMLETQEGQLAGRPMSDKGGLSVQSQGPEKAKDTQTHS